MDLGMWDLEIQEIYEDSEIPINVFVPQFILLSFLSPSFMKTRVILLTPATYRISIPPSLYIRSKGYCLQTSDDIHCSARNVKV